MECRENPVPWQGLILPRAAVSPHWDSNSQPCPAAVPDVTLTAVTRVPGSHGGSMRATLSPLHPWGQRQPKPALTPGCRRVGGCFAALTIYVCVCMYICRSPAMLEDFHYLQEPLQVRFIFLTLLRKAGTPLSQKSDTTKMCLILPESWFPSPFSPVPGRASCLMTFLPSPKQSLVTNCFPMLFYMF